MLRILLYELDRQANQDYRRALTSAGFTVRNASSVSEISEILAGDGGDLLITELEPGDAGMEIIRMVRHSEFPIPVIVVTARDEFADLKKAFEAGADDYMNKPVRMEELILRIRAVMRRAGQLNGDRHTLGNTTVNYSSMKVETPDGQVRAKGSDFVPGEEIDISVRTEYLICRSEPADSFNIKAKIRDFTNMGTVIKTSVITTSGKELRISSFEQDESLLEGQEVYLTWKPEKAVPIHRDKKEAKA